MRLAIVLVSMLAVGCCKKGSDSGSTSSPSEPSAAPEMTAKATELMSEYKANEVRADAKYKGKVIRMTGVVNEIKKDFTDSIVVTVGTGKDFELPAVSCSFGDESTAQVAAMSKGDKIDAVCKCNGLMVMHVMMTDCTIHSNYVAAPALDACKKLEAAKVASGCEQDAQNVVRFGCAGSKGFIMALAEQAAFDKLWSALPTTKTGKAFDCYSSAKTRVVACVPKAADDATKASAKTTVEGL